MVFERVPDTDFREADKQLREKRRRREIEDDTPGDDLRSASETEPGESESLPMQIKRYRRRIEDKQTDLQKRQAKRRVKKKSKRLKRSKREPSRAVAALKSIGSAAGSAAGSATTAIASDIEVPQRRETENEAIARRAEETARAGAVVDADLAPTARPGSLEALATGNLDRQEDSGPRVDDLLFAGSDVDGDGDDMAALADLSDVQLMDISDDDDGGWLL